MGTPEFAVCTLGSLLMNGFNVVGVITAPDKPAGRGRRMSKSAVKVFAEYSYLPIMQPVSLRDPKFVDDLRNLKADIFIVVAFRMLPEVIWKMPPLGTINLHGSLLPHYRGAAPINHAIINGESITGVTTFFINDQIDTGSILLREGVPIFPFENARDLHDRLMKHGARLVIRTLAGIADNSLIPHQQSEFLKPGEIPKQAPRIFPEDCFVNWDKDPVSIHNFIRGLAPSPCARTYLASGSEKLLIKIYESQPEKSEHSYRPGHIVCDGKYYMRIACRNGFLNIENLQLEGRNRMSTVEFLRGFDISRYTIPVS